METIVKMAGFTGSRSDSAEYFCPIVKISASFQAKCGHRPDTSVSMYGPTFWRETGAPAADRPNGKVPSLSHTESELPTSSLGRTP